MTRRPLPGLIRLSAIAFVIAIGGAACADSGESNSEQDAASTSGPATSLPVLRDDQVLTTSQFSELTNDQFEEQFVGLQCDEAQARAADRGFQVKCAGEGQAVTLEACACVYARVDSAGKIESIVGGT